MTNDTLSRAFDLTRAMQSAADARDWVASRPSSTNARRC